MLNFNSRGLLIPEKNILSDLSELEKEFVINLAPSNRKEIFDGYLDYLTLLKSVCGGQILTQWVDGSFVTKEYKPSDIDIVSFIPYEIFETRQSNSSASLRVRAEAKA